MGGETKETESDPNWFQKNYDIDDTETFSLHYDKDFHARKYEMLEVSDEIYEQLMSDGNDGTIEFKGEPEEEAVLCTKNKTFVVKRVDTSNTLLLCAPPGKFDDGTIERDADGKKIAKTHAASVLAFRFDGNRAQIGEVEDVSREEVYDYEILCRRGRIRRRWKGNFKIVFVVRV